MILYVDIDGVLRDLTGKLCGRSFETYDDPNFFIAWNKLKKNHENYMRTLRTAEMYKGVDIWLGLVKAQNCFSEIKILSAQPDSDSEQASIDWLNLNGLRKYFDDLIFVDKAEKKAEIINNNPGVLVDDRALTMTLLKPPSKGVWINTCSADKCVLKLCSVDVICKDSIILIDFDDLYELLKDD